MAQRKRHCGLVRPDPVRAQGNDVDVITGTAGHVKSRARWIENNPVVGVCDGQYLFLYRRGRRNVVDEHVLGRGRDVPCWHAGRGDDVDVADAVVPAGQSQQSLVAVSYTHLTLPT